MEPNDTEVMTELLSVIVRAVVDHPMAVVIEAVPLDGATCLQLRVAAADVGKIIGKQGRTARSIRTVLSAASMKLHHRFALDILEEDIRNAPNLRRD